jgi:hypothetical protein
MRLYPNISSGLGKPITDVMTSIGEKDLADLAFSGLSSHLREKMEGHDFTDVNQVLQCAMIHENRARDH